MVHGWLKCRRGAGSDLVLAIGRWVLFARQLFKGCVHAGGGDEGVDADALSMLEVSVLVGLPGGDVSLLSKKSCS